MSKGAGALIGGFVILSILFLVLVILYQFGFTSTASTSIGVNLSGTSYHEPFNQSENTSRTAYATFSMLPLLVGVMVLVFALLGMLAMAMRKR